MKEKGQWGKYMAYMRKLSLSTLNWEKDYYEKSWKEPDGIIDFLGCCSFDYDYVYKPWKDICNGYLGKMIKSKTDEYEFTQSH